MTTRMRSGFTPVGDLTRRARDQRKSPTPAEAALWSAIRHRRLGGAKFRRQHCLGTFIADFYCRDARLIVEIDGDVHGLDGVTERDRWRQEALETVGVTVLRFTNAEVLQHLDWVLDRIGETLRRRGR